MKITAKSITQLYSSKLLTNAIPTANLFTEFQLGRKLVPAGANFRMIASFSTRLTGSNLQARFEVEKSSFETRATIRRLEWRFFQHDGLSKNAYANSCVLNIFADRLNHIIDAQCESILTVTRTHVPYGKIHTRVGGSDFSAKYLWNGWSCQTKIKSTRIIFAHR